MIKKGRKPSTKISDAGDDVQLSERRAASKTARSNVRLPDPLEYQQNPRVTREHISESDRVISAARKSLRAYSLLQKPDYLFPNHITQLAHALMRVAVGQCKRLIVNIPPRHGKSLLCSTMFPAWYMGKNPLHQVITCTYGQEFADDFGRSVRDLLQTDIHQAIFQGTGLRKDSNSVSRFQTLAGGKYYAVGVGGPITGRGADLFLIDDPVKDRLTADSSTYRARLIDWFGSVAYTRLMPNAAIVLVMTRWHEDDLVGHLLQGEEKWEVIKMPAVIGGESLWPERYSYQDMMRIKQVQSAYDWHSTYMQDPIPRDGVLFTSEMIEHGMDEEYAGYIISVDPAISERQDADETAVCVVGVRWGMPTKVDEVVTLSGRWTWPQQLDVITEVYRRFTLNGKKVFTIVVEDVAYQKALIQQLISMHLPVHKHRVVGEKWLRANYTTPMFINKRVRINTEKMETQMLKFRGKSEKNDLVDALVNCLWYVMDVVGDTGYEKKVDPLAGKEGLDRHLAEYLMRQKRERAGIVDIFADCDIDSVSHDYF